MPAMATHAQLVSARSLFARDRVFSPRTQDVSKGKGFYAQEAIDRIERGLSRGKKDSPAFSFVAAGYYDSIAAAGGVPVVIPPLADEEDLEQILDTLDGVVMVGGADLDPRRDGFMLHPSVRTLDSRREDFDRMLMRLVAERRMPLFAIGVGMQLLNVSQGGNLFLHIPEDMPKALPHKDPLDPAHRHGLEVVPGTLMERVYGEGEIRVNSMHHMASDEIAPGFMVSARCPDGVVEAIESDARRLVRAGHAVPSGGRQRLGPGRADLRGVHHAASRASRRPR